MKLSVVYKLRQSKFSSVREKKLLLDTRCTCNNCIYSSYLKSSLQLVTWEEKKKTKRGIQLDFFSVFFFCSLEIYKCHDKNENKWTSETNNWIVWIRSQKLNVIQRTPIRQTINKCINFLPNRQFKHFILERQRNEATNCSKFLLQLSPRLMTSFSITVKITQVKNYQICERSHLLWPAFYVFQRISTQI